LTQLGARDKTSQPQGARFSIDCFYDRAIRFAPGDSMVRALYGAYLMATERTDLALLQFKQAVAINPNSANHQYNLGLAYLRQKDYDNARLHAKQAYALGFPLLGLKNQLKLAKQWQDDD
jgi:tetratricopeptide (TPR) repeat protein